MRKQPHWTELYSGAGGGGCGGGSRTHRLDPRRRRLPPTAAAAAAVSGAVRGGGAGRRRGSDVGEPAPAGGHQAEAQVPPRARDAEGPAQWPSAPLLNTTSRRG